MKRFWLFMYNNREASGGIGDYKGSFTTIEDAKLAADLGFQSYSEAHIIDRESFLIYKWITRPIGQGSSVWSEPHDVSGFHNIKG